MSRTKTQTKTKIKTSTAVKVALITLGVGGVMAAAGIIGLKDIGINDAADNNASPSQVNVNTNGWAYVGNSTSSVCPIYDNNSNADSSNVIFTQNNVPYVLCNSNGNLKVFMVNSNSWMNLGNSILNSGQYSAGKSRLIFDSYSGKIFAAYGYNGLLYVKKFNVPNWENVGSAIPMSSISDFSFAINPVDHLLYVALQTDTKIKIYKFNGNSWQDITSDFGWIPGVTDSNYAKIYDDNLAFDSAGNVYVARYLTEADRLYVSKLQSDGTWSILGDYIIGQFGFDFSLAINPASNKPYIAYSVYDSNIKSTITVKMFNGSSWVAVGSNILSDFSSFVSVSLIFDKLNNPMVVYYGNYERPNLQISAPIKFNGTAWENLGNPSSSYGQIVALTLNPYANELLASFDSGLYDDGGYVIKFPVAADAIPTASPDAGTYSSTQSVTLSTATAGASIYYTLDGTTPTVSSTKYIGAISISTNKTIKAIAVKDGISSSVMSKTYVINIPSHLVGGSISGLPIGRGITIFASGGKKLINVMAPRYDFSFREGNRYEITVANPIGYVCTVSNSPGIVGKIDITNVNINCIKR